jgi:hypothetical protein
MRIRIQRCHCDLGLDPTVQLDAHPDPQHCSNEMRPMISMRLIYITEYQAPKFVFPSHLGTVPIQDRLGLCEKHDGEYIMLGPLQV